MLKISAVVSGWMPATTPPATPASEAWAMPSAKNDIFLIITNTPSQARRQASTTPAIIALCMKGYCITSSISV